MADWVGRASALLTPLVDALRAHVFAGDRLHGDDTPVPVLEPGKGKTKTGRLWAYVRDGRPWAAGDAPAAAYFYSPDRKGVHPRNHLKNFRGVLHADGYAGFRDLYEPQKPGEPASIIEAACMAHVRRKFFDLTAVGPAPIAEEALRRIGELYDIEANRRPPKRFAMRWRDGRRFVASSKTAGSRSTTTPRSVRYARSLLAEKIGFLQDRTRAASAPQAFCL
jgi:hypothetical protein